MTSRWIGLLVLLACTPHEHPREPQSPCPPGMALIEADPAGAPAGDRFCIDTAEVITATYGACVKNGACTPASLGDGKACNLTRADRGDHPINCVDLEQARAYCNWVGKRLPTDVEWSRAARAGGWRGVATPPDPTRACVRDGDPFTCPVGQFPADAGGVFDLVGNVAEWTVAGDGSRLRDGSWRDDPPLDSVQPPPPAPSPTSGIRCVAAPFSDVFIPDVDNWDVHSPGAHSLAILAPPAPRHPPERPLANLALIHHGEGNHEARRWWPLGDDWLVGTDGTPDLGLTGAIERHAFPEGLREFVPVRLLGDDALLMQGGWGSNHRFVAVDRATYKIDWQIPFSNYGSTYEQFVAPRTFVAEIYGQQADAIVGFGLEDGRELWRLTGGEQEKFTRASKLWTDGERGYVLGDRGLLAFDPVTGVILWSGVPVADGCGVATGSGALIVEDLGGDGHHRLDPSSGAELGRIAHGNARCLWRAALSEGSVASAVLEDSRLLAFDAPDRRGQVTLRARDVVSGRELWRRDGLDPYVLLADHDAVYVTRAGEVLVALDAATGVPQTEISLAGEVSLSLLAGGGPRGPLLFARGNFSHTWLLGRAEQPSAPEPYTVRGRLVPDGVSRSRVSGVSVRIGEKRVRSDANGRFTARGVTRGAIAVAPGNDKGPREPGGTTVRFDPVTVVLDGRGAYDIGDVSLYHWYTE
ncbi:SUMF1/EgtB/PvdO family nonheme iron enzyme [Nannocystis pusilla]|uniref:SUMF1/EgtB/PvdO family nonheme iron enzyme n=1 Tax=Nannocystis pusilla TaxID=889268 RepID=A0ABS7TWE2_9BACT|nr:SUMF1/EgtB/PvdO family nonheme iron enzyme [Nannocystis pusilla]MBZ5712506.1 SUMF1/EgtB/PvdO family nonheme iron enzyme [Nannocystis pusilla]